MYRDQSNSNASSNAANLMLPVYIAITELQGAQMWLVKSLTFQITAHSQISIYTY
ncbi:hypothetical protein ACFX2V_02740 [Gilliamella apicola]|uniref:hypothetical protein n=1 Tax=Gilliamella TaxID=1193503 RepID=UPI0018DBF3EB|nr:MULTISPECIES: hypothetical protein [unclassified Gilliamella]MBI0028548.1 hypothetical protein [Gilliamella sp. B14448G7]MBI0035250.1 hypothetical protein [Gilliamella sp. B14448G11]MBI0042509.1 hypothetical protein [Gilliamella sp. B14448G12]